MSDPIVQEIDRRIAAYQHVREVIVGMLASTPVPAALNVRAALVTQLQPGRVAKRLKTLKAKLTGSSGTGALVMAALRGGADTLAGIAKDCKVKPSTARTALLALEEAGRVKRDGKSRATRYRLTNDK